MHASALTAITAICVRSVDHDDMLRVSLPRRSRAALTSLSIILPSDLAFTYPRFAAETHLSNALPELVQAKKLHFEARAPGSNNDVITQHLSRAIEIFKGAIPGGKIGKGTDAPAYLLKDWLACGAALARMDRLARTPSHDIERMELLALMVRTTSCVDLQDVQVFDSLCVVVAAYADAALRLAIYGDGGIGSLDHLVGHSTNLDRFRNPSDTFLTFQEMCSAVEQLIEAAYLVAVKQSSEIGNMTTIRTAYMKLCSLRGVLEIPTTGALSSAVEWIDKPSRLRGSDDYLLSVLIAMRAELRARLENSSWGMEAIDEQVDHDFLLAGERLYFHFPHSKPDGAITMTGMENLRDMYCSVAMSKAAYYLAVGKNPDGDSPGVYTHHATRQLGLSPLLLCPSGGAPQVETSSRVTVTSSRAKRIALAELERALRINRALFPHDKLNLKSGYILRLLACTYAELKDYMYANGLFNSACKVFEHHYGRQTLEVAELLRWQEAFHRFVGSTQEADTLLNQVNGIRAEHSLSAVGTLAAAGTQKGGNRVEFRAAQTRH